jgi:arylsulfatase A-like enzyme
MARIVSGSEQSAGGWLSLTPVSLALPAAFLAGLSAGDPLAPDVPLRRSLIFLGFASVLLTLLVAAARRWLRRRSEIWTARVDANVSRHLLPSALMIFAFTVGTWVLRNRGSPEMETQGRLMVAGLAGGVWIASLILVDSGRRSLVQGMLLPAFAILVATGIWLALPPASATAGNAEGRPGGVSRILLITVDTLRADALSSYGSNGTSTPHMDDLASRGVRFDQAMSPSSWTLPSMASILTGNSVPTHGAETTSSSIPPEFPTLAASLRDAGYSTGAVGVNAHLSAQRGLDRGFDHYDFYPKPAVLWNTLGGRLRAAIRPLDFLGDINSSQVTDLALHWLRRHDKGPFFLWCHYFDPHLPYAPPPAFMPETPPPGDMGLSFDDVRGIRTDRFLPTEAEREWIRQLYLAEVRYVDREIGRLLRGLAELGPPEETLVILTSDHGEEFWEHGEFEHGHTLYQEVIHVPWIITSPGRISPGIVKEPVSLTALFPTLLSLLDLPYEPATFSESAIDLNGPLPDDPAPVFSAGLLYAPHGEAVIQDGWKLIRTPSRNQARVFHLGNDPAETEDRLPHQPGRAKELTSLIEDWLAECKAIREGLGVSDSAAIELPEETLEHLEKLGYIN